MIHIKLYSELGKLLYAIANIDGTITKTEKETIKNIIKNEIVQLEDHTDKFGTNAGYYSEIEFDFLDEEMIDTESTFTSFMNFIEEHHTAFDDTMVKSCLTMLNKVANAYKKTNKKEKELLENLKNKLETIFGEEEKK